MQLSKRSPKCAILRNSRVTKVQLGATVGEGEVIHRRYTKNMRMLNEDMFSMEEMPTEDAIPCVTQSQD